MNPFPSLIHGLLPSLKCLTEKTQRLCKCIIIVVVHDRKNMDLCEAKVLASRCHGGVHLLPEGFVAVVFRQIEFCKEMLATCCDSRIRKDLRLKQVCELGNLSLLP